MLNFGKLLPQLRDMSRHQQESLRSFGQSVAKSVEALKCESERWEAIAKSVEARQDWRLVAIPKEPLAAVHPVFTCPDKYTVVSVDGSQIAADRHEIADCFLLNVGKVALTYGDPSKASLESEPSLFYADQDLYSEQNGELRRIRDADLAKRRQKAEFDELAKLIDQSPRDVPLLALVDGTMILWNFERDPMEDRRQVLADYVGMLECARERRAIIAGYISRPGSRDVATLVQAVSCGLDQASCGMMCNAANGLRVGKPCEELMPVTDRSLFQALLDEGDRSAVFASRSRVLAELEPHNRTDFFYVHVGSEVARVEAPRWITEDPELLDRLHTLVYDQAAKGAGYPRALTEAHECAVVRGKDRALMFQVLEKAMVRDHVRVEVTRKAMAKRLRSV